MSTKTTKKKYYCHDCKREIEIRGEEIKNGALLCYDDNGEKIKILKCSKCYQNNLSLSNYKECEVYSRIVGYYRPIKQWNEGKRHEYKERKEYKLKKIK